MPWSCIAGTKWVLMMPLVVEAVNVTVAELDGRLVQPSYVDRKR
jgi:hypothetical protein